MKKQHLLVVDNYDSFVYNLVQLLRETEGCTFDIVKNDAIPFGQLERYDKVLLSPGPGVPETSGQLLELITRCERTHPILGICLGHQAIAVHFGIPLLNMEHPCHGHCSQLTGIATDSKLWRAIPLDARVGRYHSWVVDKTAITESSCLRITATDEQGDVMAIEHKSLPIYGVQFHPESLISSCGRQLMDNWLEITSEK